MKRIGLGLALAALLSMESCGHFSASADDGPACKETTAQFHSWLDKMAAKGSPSQILKIDAPDQIQAFLAAAKDRVTITKDVSHVTLIEFVGGPTMARIVIRLANADGCPAAILLATYEIAGELWKAAAGVGS